jgi:hypothetical protein
MARSRDFHTRSYLIELVRRRGFRLAFVFSRHSANINFSNRKPETDEEERNADIPV